MMKHHNTDVNNNNNNNTSIPSSSFIPRNKQRRSYGIRNKEKTDQLPPPPSIETNDHRIHRTIAAAVTSTSTSSSTNTNDKVDDNDNKRKDSLDSKISQQSQFYSDPGVSSRPPGEDVTLRIGNNHDSYISTQSLATCTTDSSFPYASSLPDNSPCISSMEQHDAVAGGTTTGPIRRMSTTGSVPDLHHQSQLHRQLSHRPHRWRRVKDWILMPASHNRRVRKNKEAMEAEHAAFDPQLFFRQLEWNVLSPLLLSCAFQYDENGHRMIPVLISQLRISVTRPNNSNLGHAERKRNLFKRTRNRLYLSRRCRSTKLCNNNIDGTKEEEEEKQHRHHHHYSNNTTDMFKIVVEYGNNNGDRYQGVGNRHYIQWVVYRRYWDFVRLHYHFLSHDILKKRNISIPSLPRLHQIRRSGYINKTWQRSTKIERHLVANELRHEASNLERQQQRKHHRHHLHRHPSSSQQQIKRVSTCGQQEQQQNDEEKEEGGGREREPDKRWNSLDLSFNLGLESETDPNCIPNMIEDSCMFKYRALERYLYALARTLWISPQINRFCKFLEISKLGLSLCISDPEGYHGKEGYLTIVDRTDRQIVKNIRDGLFCGMIARQESKRIPRWFIVRESYLIVCAGGPDTMAIEDVFLIDNAFRMERLSDEKQSKCATIPLFSRANKWNRANHTFCVSNYNTTWHLKAKNSQQARQFFESIQHMAKQSVWSRSHPFESYAPIRHHTSASWFIDGRDYFWEVSIALENAKETIYIHDWWLYLRRPPCENEDWRLDRILKRKAQQGIKIYIIIYKEVAVALPLYSHYSKKRLLSLSPDNIYVQRHPSRATDIFNKNNSLFYAHHEKICVVDNFVAFIGGIDLCFGRWDNEQHVVVDNGPLNNKYKDATMNPGRQQKQPQIWPGKDYSNPRILDFHTLDKPFEDNMDRKKLPRMPWHDVSVRMTGQPARDIARHFVQRWNFLRRSKPRPPKRPTPLLLVKPDIFPSLPITPLVGSGPHSQQKQYIDPRIGELPISHVCCIQLLRSVSQWSLGTQDHVEASIQNAYVEVIRHSEHFVYIENQFFITATQCGSTKINNRVGDALVNRIIQAKKTGTRWRAIIVLPLVPGFQSEINDAEASTIRLIMYCQYKSINRGPHSIFGRLRSAGVTNPEEYITFYGLRNWGELDNGHLVTEQVYVHAKVLIADDRTIIIGSANINERSLLGNRDSEIAACIHDNEIIASTLHGRPAKVGAFAQSLRLRLMSEHLGIGLECDQTKKEGKKQQRQQQQLEERKGKERSSTTTKIDTISSDNNDNKKSKQQIKERSSSISNCDSMQAMTSLFTHQQFEKSPNQNLLNNLTPTAPSKTVRTRPSWVSDDCKLTITVSSPTTKTPFCTIGNNNSSNTNHDDIPVAENSNPTTATINRTVSMGSDEQQKSKLWKRRNSRSSEKAEAQKSTLTAGTSSNISCSQKHDEQHVQFWEKLCCDPHIDGSGTDQGDQLLSDAAIAATAAAYNKDNEQGNNPNSYFQHVQDILRDPLSPEFMDFWHTTARRNSHLFRCAFLVMPDNNVQTWDEFNEFQRIAKTCLGRKDPATSGTHKEMMLSGARRRGDSSTSHNSHPAQNDNINSFGKCLNNSYTTRRRHSSSGIRTSAASATNTGIISPPSLAPLPAAADTGSIPERAHDYLCRVQGQLVIWPIHFLEKEDDKNEFLYSMDRIAPLEIFD
ncbi:hypothetical protein BDA99DRAFT_506023 [Phascolomyces articulosus]|uniref:Phospholipase D1 n=1 Tax=Phascolomyces articulosus TaxID=60185 RepID=A0AAD5KCI6_9FUNG|nr:hypothetical protein BDA99DRAFT_506023 [Phascolomyces articulosus]